MNRTYVNVYPDYKHSSQINAYKIQDTFQFNLLKKILVFANILKTAWFILRHLY